MTWVSDQYIGMNKNIQLTHDLEEGHTETSPIDPSTIATLVTVSNGKITESSLQLTASASFPTASVECRGENSLFMINFTLLGMYSL